MNILPRIAHATIPRPGRHEFEPPYMIPNSESSSVWSEIYSTLSQGAFHPPLQKNTFTIDPYRGYYGKRPHPTGRSSSYFHIGTQFLLSKGEDVTPISEGILEYSGYGAINGYYVLLSHPEYVTEDGYVLHSMYCHLKKPLVGFNSYQKMLREISLGSHPLIPISRDTVLGLAGSSGVVDGEGHVLYLQLDFRKYGEVPIVLDPYLILNGEKKENLPLPSEEIFQVID